MIGVSARGNDRGKVELDPKSSPLQCCGIELYGCDDRAAKIDLAELARRPAGDISFSERVERPRETHHAVDLLVQRLESSTVRGHDPVAKRLQVALQVGERSAQLVRGIGDELAPHPLLFLDLAGHAVERRGEGADLLGSARSHAHGMVALRDQLRGVADLP